jgi:hypothetical protein
MEAGDTRGEARDGRIDEVDVKVKETALSERIGGKIAFGGGSREKSRGDSVGRTMGGGGE